MARPRRRRALLAVAASAVGGWWVSGLEPFSAHATVVVLAVGVAAMAVGAATRGVPSTRAAPGPPVVPWAVLVGALAAWQLAAFVQQPRSDHPTLSSMTNAVLDARPVRALAFAAWTLTAGWLARP